MRLLSTCIFLVLAQAASAQSVSDDFNRPDSTNMGPDWSEQNGDPKIVSNHGVGASPSRTTECTTPVIRPRTTRR